MSNRTSTTAQNYFADQERLERRMHNLYVARVLLIPFFFLTALIAPAFLVEIPFLQAVAFLSSIGFALYFLLTTIQDSR